MFTAISKLLAWITLGIGTVMVTWALAMINKGISVPFGTSGEFMDHGLMAIAFAAVIGTLGEISQKLDK